MHGGADPPLGSYLNVTAEIVTSMNSPLALMRQIRALIRARTAVVSGVVVSWGGKTEYGASIQ